MDIQLYSIPQHNPKPQFLRTEWLRISDESYIQALLDNGVILVRFY